MKTIAKYSKLFMLLLDVFIISCSTVVANLLLTNKNIIFTNENIYIIKNSVLIAIVVYEIYLILFKVNCALEILFAFLPILNPKQSLSFS